jgi:hypothetical protein
LLTFKKFLADAEFAFGSSLAAKKITASKKVGTLIAYWLRHLGFSIQDT